MRSDITAAIGHAPPNVQHDLTTVTSGCLALLDEHLPKNETVQYVSTAAPRAYDVPEVNSILAVTDQRLLFVAPAPQVISWYLTDLDKVQALSQGRSVETFFVEGNGSEFQLGIDGGYGSRFTAQLKQLIAVARLRNG